MALDHPEDALAPGSHVGEYEILRVLGRGGFGVTYAARSRGQSGTMVAIKELFPVGMCVRESGGRVIPSSETDRGDLDLANDMFCRESQIICTIHHINLVRGIEWISQNNTGYLVMQYASGKNLHEHIRARRGSFQVSPITVAQLCRGVLAGLSTLHGNGICHCDIKPDNIFLGVGFEPILTIWDQPVCQFTKDLLRQLLILVIILRLSRLTTDLERLGLGLISINFQQFCIDASVVVNFLMRLIEHLVKAILLCLLQISMSFHRASRKVFLMRLISGSTGFQRIGLNRSCIGVAFLIRCWIAWLPRKSRGRSPQREKGESSPLCINRVTPKPIRRASKRQHRVPLRKRVPQQKELILSRGLVNSC